MGGADLDYTRVHGLGDREPRMQQPGNVLVDVVRQEGLGLRIGHDGVQLNAHLVQDSARVTFARKPGRRAMFASISASTYSPSDRPPHQANLRRQSRSMVASASA